MTPSALAVVKHFWQLMASNDFESVGAVLSDDFVLEWPQSRERIRGRDNFAAMNRNYPAHGMWRFTVNRVFGDESRVVSDVSITDGVQHARAISFFTVKRGLITHLHEFWPDDYPAPANRAQWVENIE